MPCVDKSCVVIIRGSEADNADNNTAHDLVFCCKGQRDKGVNVKITFGLQRLLLAELQIPNFNTCLNAVRERMLGNNTEG